MKINILNGSKNKTQQIAEFFCIVVGINTKAQNVIKKGCF